MEPINEVEQFGLSWDRKSNLIKVIGVGGGGTNAVSYMYSQDIKYVDFVVCNTDVQALEMSPVPYKVQLGEVLTRGLGAGTDPTKGRRAAKESLESIDKMLGDDTEMVFITCGMGGGTGTGAAPVIAEQAKKKDMLTVGVVTIPFRDEGPEALYRAVEGIKELNKYVDSLLVIDNAKLYEVYGDLAIFETFPKADEVLATAVKSIAEIITCRGYINVDFADVQMIIKNSGMAIMGKGVASGTDRAQEAVKQAFESPLLNEYDIHSAKNVLVNITSSSEPGKTMTGNELSQIMDYIKKYTGETGHFKRGLVKNDSIGENISVTIVATGFEMAQLPVVSEDTLNNHNRIVVKFEKKYSESKKRGVPLCPERQSQIVSKSMITGKPALITDDPKTIKELKSEPAITRRDRMFKEQQVKEQ